MQLVRKISRATVFGDKEAILDLVMKDKGKPHRIYTVYGVCRGSRLMRADENEQTAGKGMKDSTALIGEFRAVNIDGEQFASGVCYVPQYLADLVSGQLGGDSEGIRFAFDMTVQYDKASATSYQYGATLIGEVKESDPLKELEQSVLAHIGAKQIENKSGEKPTKK